MDDHEQTTAVLDRPEPSLTIESEQPSLQPSDKRPSRGRGVIIVLSILLVLLLGVSAVGGAYILRQRRQLQDKSSTEQMLAELQVQYQDLQVQLESVQEQLRQSDDDNAQLTSANADLQEQKTELEQQLESLQSEIDKLQRENEQYEELLTDRGAPHAITMQVPENYAPTGKLAALTFDDGPGAYTNELLDILAEEGVKATFFVVGTNAERYTGLLQRMHNEGHVLANHSYDHAHLPSLSLYDITENLDRCADIIYEATGTYPEALRPPGGNYNQDVMTYASLSEIPIVNWSVDTRDWESRNTDKILEIAYDTVHDGAIILMHDIYRTTVDAVRPLIHHLRQEGYTLVTVPELLAARCETVQAGAVYRSPTSISLP